MNGWQAATGAFFIYIAIVALSQPQLIGRKRRLALAGAAAGLLIVALATLRPQPILNDWLVPPAALLLGYWTSGLLFVAPMPRVERVLLSIDRELSIDAVAAATPRVLAELLEVAYAAVYPVIPLALIVYLVAIESPDAARFWTVILVTDYICFGMLPWVQTRPPRALEPAAPWHARFRTLNVRLLGKTSNHVNTFPSGHAAEALAAALLVSGAPIWIVILMSSIALAISAGAVLGRYHYAADVLAGWLVASVVWLLVMQGPPADSGVLPPVTQMSTPTSFSDPSARGVSTISLRV